MRDTSVPTVRSAGPRVLRWLLPALLAAGVLGGVVGLGPSAADARGPSQVTHQGATAGPGPAKVQGAGPAAVFYRGPATRRVVALTFDDGWSAANALAIYRVLMAQHVPATFFLNSTYLGRGPSVWRAIAAAGFPVGNHTYSHRNVTTLTRGQIIADLQRNARTFKKVTGQAMARLFRPPYGSRTPASDAAAAAAGFPTVVMWSIDTNDWRPGRSVAAVRASASSGGPGAIVLMHAGPAVTPLALAGVIRSYRARGFGFVTVPVLLKVPWRAPASAPAWNRDGVAGPIPPLPADPGSGTPAHPPTAPLDSVAAAPASPAIPDARTPAPAGNAAAAGASPATGPGRSDAMLPAGQGDSGTSLPWVVLAGLSALAIVAGTILGRRARRTHVVPTAAPAAPAARALSATDATADPMVAPAGESAASPGDPSSD